ncbi:MAG TPA: GNAT family N-acetyltransferase [Symbiobacteriaceae bacterium]|jgi:GNAT superfamily N-acetyltransferase
MALVRFWQSSDLPYLLHMAAVTAWEIMPPDDRLATTFATVAKNAQNNVTAVLGSPGGTAVVADVGGVPVGYLLVGIQAHDRTGQPQGYMADIYVAPEFRRAGLSKELHLVAEEYLRSIGITRATNWTHAHNSLGLGAGRRHGYDLWGMMMVKHLRRPVPTSAGV